MKLRSVSELTDYIDRDLTWRKREISTMKLQVGRARQHEQDPLVRAGVCLLYAHWEGFVKQTSTAYLNYVARKGLKYRELQASLVALSLRSQFAVCGESTKITLRADLTEFLLSDLNESASIPWDDAVDTRSNLKCEVLKEITRMLNVDYTSYAVKELIIDGKLLYYRNNIAHGAEMMLPASDYEELHREVLWLLERFRDDVENAAVVEAYKRK